MDDYPAEYVDHNLPLVLLSGLGPDAKDEDAPGAFPPSPLPQQRYPLLQENPVQIFSDFPLLTDPTAIAVRDALLRQDASDTPWNAGGDKKTSAPGVFAVKRVGRSYNLPPRKANPPATSSSSDSRTGDADDGPTLHSPISPLSPNSPTFPDGIMTQFWMAKHLNLVPAAFVNFLPFSTDHNMASLRDNQLKIEINSQKKEWAASGYKTRFVVALLCEDGRLPDDAGDRLAAIRRATNLDVKSVFVLRPHPSDADIAEFTRLLFSSLQGPCVEYYRDLSKHARRKRNRSTIPPPTAPPTTGTSKTLAQQGWNIRYEFKLGVFAEFRQEMDAACRNYESAYESLFGEEVFETIAGWSPRFGDARMLADVLAIRMIRCYLWADQTTGAVRVWLLHKGRIADIVGRRGKGTNNYGWEAWRARWSLVMAQLMRRAEILALPDPYPESSVSLTEASKSICASPEKGISHPERINAWQLLHHEGYWLVQAAQHTARRRIYAEQIPDEDQVPPSQSPAHKISSRSNVYDTYLCPEPYVEGASASHGGVNHAELILSYLRPSVKEFSKRHQMRMVEQQSLDMARELMRLKLWDEALQILRPLWPTLTWRQNGWWELMEDFAWTLRECAFQAKDSETILRVDWELMNQRFSVNPRLKYDFDKSLEGFPVTEVKPAVVLKAGDAVSCLTPSLVFAKGEGNVGEPLRFQLAIMSHAHSGSTPISLTEVKVAFEGSLRSIRILPDAEAPHHADESCEILDVPLHDFGSSDRPLSQSSASGPPSSISGTANLTFSPSQTKAFNLTSIPREAGEVRLASLTLMIEGDNYNITHIVTDQSPQQRLQQQQQAIWWTPGKGNKNVARRIGKDRDTNMVRILPKPPKVHITTPNLRQTYYTDERVTLDVRLDNLEDEATEISVDIRLVNAESETPATYHWVGDEDADDQPSETSDEPPDEEPPPLGGRSKRRSVGTLAKGESRTLAVEFANTSQPAAYGVELTASYHLVSDIETPIFKTISFDLSFVRPFEANYELLPRVHPAPWPDFFHCDGVAGDNDDDDDDDGGKVKTQADGLSQRWSLSSKMVSFALEPLVIEEVKVVVVGISAGKVRHIGEEITEAGSLIRPEGLRESEFMIDIQRLALDERQATSLNLGLDVRWRREDDSASSPTSSSSSTILPVPRFVIPMGEPRILAVTPTASTESTIALPGLIHVDYILENPSIHFLTFNVTMEASDQFAFSGPKTQAIQLVPLARHTLRYRLLATATGRWIQPQLIVVDSYFNKTLRVLPTEGMRADKKGIWVWVGD